MNPLDELIAREAIKEAKARYCRLLDTKQWEAWGECFTEDVVMDVTDDVGDIADAQNIIKGRQAVVEQVSKLIHPSLSTHQVHSCEITFISASQATVIWAMEDWVTFPDGHGMPFKSVNGRGYYHETYRQDSGSWRIAKLRLERLQREFTQEL
jgi:3-phenylpropionate/cinnamic acid dioxygenase small subunit